MSSLDRMAAQMRQMDEFFRECEPLPEPGQIVDRGGQPFRILAPDPHFARLSDDLCARMHKVALAVARARAEAIERWFLAEATQLLPHGCTIPADSDANTIAALLRGNGISLDKPEFEPGVLPMGEEVFVIMQHGKPVTGMRLRMCLGSDGCKPLPVEFES